jgi:excisionase family DNA binding protein
LAQTTRATERPAAQAPLLLRVPEVAELLSLGLTKTWALVNSGEIPSVTIGKSRRVRAQDLAAWLDEKETER